RPRRRRQAPRSPRRPRVPRQTRTVIEERHGLLPRRGFYRGAPRVSRGASERWGVWGAISGPPILIGETAKGDPLVICPLLRARPLQRVPDAVVQSAVARAPALDGEDGDAQGGRAALGVRLGAGAVDEGDETCGRYGPSGCGRAGDRDRVGRSDVGRRAGAS